MDLAGLRRPPARGVDVVPRATRCPRCAAGGLLEARRPARGSGSGAAELCSLGAGGLPAFASASGGLTVPLLTPGRGAERIPFGLAIELAPPSPAGRRDAPPQRGTAASGSVHVLHHIVAGSATAELPEGGVDVGTGDSLLLPNGASAFTLRGGPGSLGIVAGHEFACASLMLVVPARCAWRCDADAAAEACESWTSGRPAGTVSAECAASLLEHLGDGGVHGAGGAPCEAVKLHRRALRDLQTYRIKGQRNRLALVFDPVETGVPFTFCVEIFPPGFRTPHHAHENGHELFFVLAGSGEGHCDGERFAITAGDAVVFPPGHVHGLDNTTGADLYCLEMMVPNDAMAEMIRAGESAGGLADDDLCILASVGCGGARQGAPPPSG